MMNGETQKVPRFSWPVSFYPLSVYRFYYVLQICVLTVAILSFPGISAQSNAQNCVTNYDPNTDYFPVKSEVSVASRFTLKYEKNYKILNHTSAQKVYVLYQCGTPAPTLSFNATLFAVPITVSGCGDTTCVTFLEVLGKGPTIKSMTNRNDSTSSCFQFRVSNGLVSELPTGSDYQADYNTSRDLGLEVVFGSGSGSKINPLLVGADSYAEVDILGRTEWVKYYGAFFNAEAQANAQFDRIASNFNCLDLLANLTIGNQPKAPVIAWLSQTYLSTGIDNANPTKSFKNDLVFGTSAITPTLSKSWATPQEALAELQAKGVTIIIDETYFTPPAIATYDDVLAIYGLDQNTVANTSFNGNIYREDFLLSNLGGLDWFSGGIVFADAFLSDMMDIINGSLPTPSYTRKWLRNVKNEPTVRRVFPGGCANPNNYTLVSPAPACSSAFFTTYTSSSSVSGTTTSGSATGIQICFGLLFALLGLFL